METIAHPAGVPESEHRQNMHDAGDCGCTEGQTPRAAEGSEGGNNGGTGLLCRKALFLTGAIVYVVLHNEE